MVASETQTTERLEGDKITQFSVFIENKVGRLLDLTRIMDHAGIHILGVSIIDTADCGIDRLVVDDPDRTRQVFHEHGVAFTETSVVVAEMNGADELKKILAALFQGECNIHFMYSLLSRPKGKPCIVLHVEDDECATNLLRSGGFRVLSQRDLSR